MRMSWIKSRAAKESLIVLVVSIILLLLVDYFLGYTILKQAPISSRNNAERGIKIRHPVYHHTLSANYDGLGRNQSEYRFCTNSDGLKSKCGAVSDNKEIDIGFLGDSFTEGLGLPYEKTFVGLIAEKLPGKKIANLGAASYSPSIYYLKLKDFLENGYKFNEVVVYIDISDIADEANYVIVDGKVVDTIENTGKQKMFPLVNFGLKGLQDRLISAFGIMHHDYHVDYLDLSDPVYQSDFRRAAWTFDDRNEGYGKLGVKGSIAKSIEVMQKLYDLCKTNNIKLSIGVYPWPSQILYDIEESNQVKIWRNFCTDKCTNFYNSFPTFFDMIRSTSKKEVINNNFFHGDMHFNENGNQLIAADFLKTYKNN
ncbi:conserved hypothetical protein [Candidatus Nitrotoga sp. BS]|nr:conserved hypothetical protein [Candidatus Nitrotoga sp. BS]